MSTEKSIRDGEDFTAQIRRDAAVALLSRIERKVLLTEDELLDQLDISHRSLMAAVKAGGLFNVESSSGSRCYPAFFADQAYNRRSLAKVARALKALGGSAKYHFFMSKSHSLGS
jgi:hypothetical protein